MSNFPHVRPETLGISPVWIEKFLDHIRDEGLFLHSFMICREGRCAAEGYWEGYDSEYLHRLYSSTKSFVAMAIGVAADNGLLDLDDPITKYFPDLVDEKTIDPWVAGITIRHMLTMSTAYSRPTYDDPYKHGYDWTASYFRAKADHPSGMLYHYDSCGSYVLGALVKRVTGKPFMDYLYEKVFSEMGFHPDTRCIEGPDGESWAGSGGMARLCDFAAATQLLMDGGRYHGKQLISEKFVSDAISPLVDNNTEGTNNPWLCGYGYQIRVLKDGAFAFVGLGGQLSVAIPKYNFLFACNANTTAAHGGHYQVFDILWREIVEKLGTPVEPDDAAAAHLNERLANLKFTPQSNRAAEAAVPTLARINGKRWKLEPNPMGIDWMSLTIDGDHGTLSWHNERGEKELDFAIGGYAEDGFPETHFPGERLGYPANREFRAFSSGGWTEAGKFVIRTMISDMYIGTLTIALSFVGDEIGVCMAKNAQFFLNEYNGWAGGKLLA